MNNNSLFDFAVDKSAKTVTINMEFDADQSMVWDAFTKPEILDQWYAPKPFQSKTKYMDFKVGGRRFYAMVGPDGQESWALQTYKSITPKTNYTFFNAFADKDENPQLPGSDWNVTFIEENGRTKVNISIYNESLERMERLMDGFKEGMRMTYEQLASLLPALSHA